MCISSLKAKGQQLQFGQQSNKQAIWMQTDDEYCDDTRENQLSSTQSQRLHFFRFDNHDRTAVNKIQVTSANIG